MTRAVGAFVVFTLAATSVFAQDPQPPARASDDAVTAAITPYLWVTGFDGTIDVVDQTAILAASSAGGAFTSKLGSCATFELRAGRAGFVADFTFATVADSGSADAGSPVDVRVRSMTLSNLIGYRVVDNPRASVDVLVGVRIIHFGPSLSTGGPAGGDLTDTWAESIGGARAQLHGGAAWSVALNVDAGGRTADQFGGSWSWHAEALARWRLSGHVSVIGGYKQIYIHRDWQPLLFDGTERGVTVGMLVDRLGQQ